MSFIFNIRFPCIPFIMVLTVVIRISVAIDKVGELKSEKNGKRNNADRIPTSGTQIINAKTANAKMNAIIDKGWKTIVRSPNNIPAKIIMLE